MFSAGAALAALDTITRHGELAGIQWRKRLAVSGAAAYSDLRAAGKAKHSCEMPLPGANPVTIPALPDAIGGRALGETRVKGRRTRGRHS